MLGVSVYAGILVTVVKIFKVSSLVFEYGDAKSVRARRARPPVLKSPDKALSLSHTHTDDSLTVHELGHELEVTSPWGRVGIP